MDAQFQDIINKLKFGSVGTGGGINYANIPFVGSQPPPKQVQPSQQPMSQPQGNTPQSQGNNQPPIIGLGGTNSSPFLGFPQSASTASPYNYFKQSNTPQTDTGASNLSSNLMKGYGEVGYKPKTAQDYLPPELLVQLGQVTSGLSGYKPEKIDVGQVQTKPIEYYQSQIEDLSKPLTDQYSLARANARGDQAARGTLYDSQGYKDIGQLDKSYLDQLGNVTRGVQQERMQEEQQNQQAYIDRLLQEATGRRDLGLQGLTAGGNQALNASQLFGNLGTTENKNAIDAALQNKGLDANTINSLLGYGADRYGTEADLFGKIYGSDTDYNKSLIENQTKSSSEKLNSIIDLLGLQGYQGIPQEQVFKQLLEQLGYNINTPISPQMQQAFNSGDNGKIAGSLGLPQGVRNYGL